jgi:hypothetical protein
MHHHIRISITTFMENTEKTQRYYYFSLKVRDKASTENLSIERFSIERYISYDKIP